MRLVDKKYYIDIHVHYHYLQYIILLNGLIFHGWWRQFYTIRKLHILSDDLSRALFNIISWSEMKYTLYKASAIHHTEAVAHHLIDRLLNIWHDNTP